MTIERVSCGPTETILLVQRSSSGTLSIKSYLSYRVHRKMIPMDWTLEGGEEEALLKTSRFCRGSSLAKLNQNVLSQVKMTITDFESLTNNEE